MPDVAVAVLAGDVRLGDDGVEVVGAGDVADAEVDGARQVRRRLRARVHLRVQVVEDDPLLGGVRELARQRRTDEAGAARDEDPAPGLREEAMSTTLGAAGRNPDVAGPRALADSARMSRRRPPAPPPGALPLPRPRASLEVGVASVLWGTGGLAVQLIREQEPLSPVTISAWRMTIAAVVLLVALLALRRGGELVDLARSRPRQLLAVGVGTAAYQGFYFVSVTQVGVAVSTVVSLGLAPVLLTIAESVRHRRAPAARAAGGARRRARRAAAGQRRRTRVVDRPGAGRRGAARDRVGYDVRPDDRRRRLDQPYVVAAGADERDDARRGCGAAAVPRARRRDRGVTTDPVALAWLAYLGALTMALAYVLLYSGLRVVAPSTAVTASLVEPVTAAVVAAVVLDEALGPVAVVGILLVLGRRRGARPADRSGGAGAAGPGARPTDPLRVLHVDADPVDQHRERSRRGRRARAGRPCWTAAGGTGRCCRGPCARRGWSAVS